MSDNLDFKETDLWKRAFENPANEESRTAIEELKTAFLQMRKNIEHIVARAHCDCAGLTLHDLSHLDAFWKIAGDIIGPNYPINP